MDDLISRKAVLDALGEPHPMDYNACSAVHRVKSIPAVDAVPVVHGRWIPSEKYAGYNACSNCGDCYIDPEWAMNGKWHYCPHCGAKMDGAEEEPHEDQT